MKCFEAGELESLSEAFAFLGNSLLSPINMTPKVGLDPEFWEEFPDFGDDGVRAALDRCRDFARACVMAERDGEAAALSVATEYTMLFIGPPKPAAPPWETAYVPGSSGSGFGQPTFEMRALLREAGLTLSNENNQYEDHMGIELLLLSVLLHRAATGEASVEEAESFARAHPKSWVAPFRDRVCAASGDGYYACLLGLVQALLA